MRRVASSIVAVALLAGCLGGAQEDPRGPLGPTEGVPDPAPYLALESCSEINLLVPRDETSELPGFMTTSRAAGRVATGLITIFSCEEGRTEQGPVGEAAAYTYLFSVDELGFLRLPGAAGYLFLTQVRAEDRSVAHAFGRWAPSEVVLSLSVNFDDIGNMPDAQGSASVMAPGGSTSYESVMLQPGAPGTGGYLGMYTVNETHVQLHNVTFGDYFGYQQGAGSISNPGPNEQGAVQAYHNVGYDVRFDFGVAEAPRPQ